MQYLFIFHKLIFLTKHVEINEFIDNDVYRIKKLQKIKN